MLAAERGFEIRRPAVVSWFRGCLIVKCLLQVHKSSVTCGFTLQVLSELVFPSMYQSKVLPRTISLHNLVSKKIVLNLITHVDEYFSSHFEPLRWKYSVLTIRWQTPSTSLHNSI